ncbi:hypothetical protein vseg_016104 [Gypsophila vaccaria]
MKGRSQPVQWHTVVRNRWVTPRHQFIGWLFAHGALKTKDKLKQLGMELNEDCYLCGQDEENTDHIFFSCPYSRQVIQCLRDATSLSIPYHGVLEWCLARQGKAVQKGMKFAISLGALYHTWQQRNNCRMENKIFIPKSVAHYLLEDIRILLRSRNINCMDTRDKDWLKDINLL